MSRADAFDWSSAVSLVNPTISVKTIAASLAIPYSVLNKNEKNNFPKSILNITDSEKEIYEQAYSKKLKQRKIKYAVGSCIVAGVTASLMFGNSFSISGFGGGGGMNCGPPCGSDMPE